MARADAAVALAEAGVGPFGDEFEGKGGSQQDGDEEDDEDYDPEAIAELQVCVCEQCLLCLMFDEIEERGSQRCASVCVWGCDWAHVDGQS